MERVVHSPEAHIPMAYVTAENGVIYLRFKKKNVLETITLDQFLNLIILAINDELPDDYCARYFG